MQIKLCIRKKTFKVDWTRERGLAILNRIANRLDPAISNFPALDGEECLKVSIAPYLKSLLQGDPSPLPLMLNLLEHVKEHADEWEREAQENWTALWNRIAWKALTELTVAIGAHVAHFHPEKSLPSMKFSEILPTAIEPLLTSIDILEEAAKRPERFHFDGRGDPINKDGNELIVWDALARFRLPKAFEEILRSV